MTPMEDAHFVKTASPGPGMLCGAPQLALVSMVAAHPRGGGLVHINCAIMPPSIHVRSNLAALLSGAAAAHPGGGGSAPAT